MGREAQNQTVASYEAQLRNIAHQNSVREFTISKLESLCLDLEAILAALRAAPSSPPSLQQGLGLVWIPGELPAYILDARKFKYQCEESSSMYEHRELKKMRRAFVSNFLQCLE